MLKIGDKVYCYTQCDTSCHSEILSGPFKEYIFKKGKLYEITYIDDHTIILLCDIDKITKKIIWGFNREKVEPSFSDHFYTTKQLRKLKLKKIEERR